MNIFFVYSVQDVESFDKPLGSLEFIQFGISYISALLKKHGHQTKLAVVSRSYRASRNRGLLFTAVEHFKPGIICFTAVSSEYDYIKNIAQQIKARYPNIYLLIGGASVTLQPDHVLEDGFDALCIGEGEYPVLELVSCLEKGAVHANIPNLWIKSACGIEKNPTRPFLTDLDSLPHPDRQMWEEWVKEGPQARLSMLLGRGCPFECAYCSNHALKKIATGPYVRLRSTEKIIDEIRAMVRQFPRYQEIYLEIETFYIDKQWALELCRKLKALNAELINPLSFGVNMRITPATNYEPLFSAMQESSFRFINIGLEAGSERVRSSILRRNYSNADILSAVAQARKYGLKISFFNLIGIPGETSRDYEETVKINRLCQPDWIMPSIFFPYPGTDLYEICRDNGLLTDVIDTKMERNRPVMDLPGFSQRQILKGYELFNFYIYRGYKPLYKLILNVFVMRLRRWPWLFLIYKTLRQNSLYRYLKNQCAHMSGARKLTLNQMPENHQTRKAHAV